MSQRRTKTQQALLDRLKQQPRIAVERFYGRGPEGGRVAGGDREVQAALALEQQGVLERVSYSNSAHPNRGYTIHNTVIVFQMKGTE